ncbi:unnamed protein product, partial [Adineta steineri]
VLDEEIRRTESQWINYSDDCLQMKFDVADLIFQQLVQESITECLSVVDKRLFLSKILCLNNRPIVYSKWRVSNARRNGTEKFETVLDEEIRRTESQWINYSDDCLQMKFDVADLIFQQLVQESIAECLSVVDKRLFLSSNSTRL